MTRRIRRAPPRAAACLVAVLSLLPASMPDAGAARDRDRPSTTERFSQPSRQAPVRREARVPARREQVVPERTDLRTDRRTDRTVRQSDRTDTRSDRQDNRTERTGLRQQERTERVGDRTDLRRDIVDSIDDGRYWRHHRDYYQDYWRGGDDWAFFLGLTIGTLVATLPALNQPVVVSGTTYYYANGVYFIRRSGQYMVVSAPPGAIVTAPPAQVEVVVVGNREVGYANGTFYDVSAIAEGDPQYKVVAPPVGATVPSLPAGAEKVTAGGTDYFVYADTYYRPFHSGSDVIYRVVGKP